MKLHRAAFKAVLGGPQSPGRRRGQPGTFRAGPGVSSLPHRRRRPSAGPRHRSRGLHCSPLLPPLPPSSVCTVTCPCHDRLVRGSEPGTHRPTTPQGLSPEAADHPNMIPPAVSMPPPFCSSLNPKPLPLWGLAPSFWLLPSHVRHGWLRDLSYDVSSS